MNQEYASFKCAVHAIIMDDEDRILLMLRQNTGYGDGMWGLPAGHVEKGETPLRALHRELQEELGITIDSTLAEFHSYIHYVKPEHQRDYCCLFYKVYEWEGEIVNKEPDKCVSFGFMSMPPPRMIPYVEYGVRCEDKHGIFVDL